MNAKTEQKPQVLPEKAKFKVNPQNHYDLIVIGSGPGGRSAAIQGAKLGKRVLVIEKGHKIGGVSVHTGTIPSKTMRETVLNLSGMREREFYGLSYRVKENISAQDILERLNKTLSHEVEIQEIQFQRNQVETLYGMASFADKNHIQIEMEHGENVIVRGETIIIAVGTKPYRPDYVPFNGQTVIDSDELLSMEKIPSSLAVVGAGVIGLEYATIFSALDVSVTLIDPRTKILDFVDREIIQYMVNQLRDRGVTFRLGHKVESIERDEVSGRHLCHLHSGRLVKAEMVLFAAGRVGSTSSLGLENCGLDVDERGRVTVNNDFQTSVDNIYAVGDVIGFPSLASTSMEQGRVAVCRAYNQPMSTTSEYFPYGIYSVPEISMVGMTEEDVQKRNIPYEVGVARFRETARGQIMGLTTGLMKCIFSIKTRRLLGVHIVGEGATELVHIGQAVMAHKGKLNFFIDNTFNYPTLAEAYKIAALDALGRMPVK
ncbi:Si-specific NAD(P)(+) transhydrogenase [Leucothrix pacifica]|uniref:Soluble pyridine nucleotide transhydrogenase n=1 Tax=Leucothrix pacifica TaxID=1247513 RepID=A0A317CPF5_9GAMM|nr:Si-specific NAD(P)(+) transhydrogenase [Leucothrix pacifica]PWR00556.1 Si-specific NAD(P)(+) transhydrogenase [Leucothrix pacifica]